MTIKIELITSERAAQILRDANIDNRKLKPWKVEAIARDMRAGVFILTHQGIAFDVDGRLLDGQHRLAAIVLAGKPCSLLVTKNLPRTTRVRGLELPTWDVIDKVTPRRDGESLTRRTGVKNGNKLAAVLRVLLKVADPSTSKEISLPQIELALEVMGSSAEPMVALSESCRHLYRPTAPVVAAFTLLHISSNGAAVAEALLQEAMDITGTVNAPTRALVTWTRGHIYNGGAGWVPHFRVASSIIQAHVEGKALKKVYGSETAAEWLKDKASAPIKKLKGIMSL
jgi:hypothetical protein